MKTKKKYKKKKLTSMSVNRLTTERNRYSKQSKVQETPKPNTTAKENAKSTKNPKNDSSARGNCQN